MKEEWKLIDEFPYIVSNLGNIRHRDKLINRVLTKDKSGYLRVSFRNGGYKQKTMIVHRLVAKAFISNPNNFNEINHIDGNKSNNKVTNLEWSNRSLNIQHSFRTGLQISLKGSEIGNSKLNENVVKLIKFELKAGKSQNSLAKIYNVDQATIWRIAHNKCWKHVEIS